MLWLWLVPIAALVWAIYELFFRAEDGMLDRRRP